jgi:RNA polymerase sigma-70 factor (ECF subfamily)
MPDDDLLEARIRAACDAADHSAATTLLVEHYGGEILAFLIARVRSRSDAEEVFAMVAEKLWLGLPNFEWRCTARGWAYRIARNVANDYAAAAHNRPARRRNLSEHASISKLIDRVRTITPEYQRTPVKDRMQELRERLPPDDQMLLVLRIDRGMTWRDLAAAIGDGALDGAALEKEAARLRKRFERVKEQLRELARSEGLLS